MEKVWMNKEIVLEQIKAVMIDKVNQLHYLNADEIQQDILKFMEYLRLTDQLPIPQNKPIVSFELEKKQEEREDEVKQLINNKEIENVHYLFERKVRGGVIIGLDGGYVIPERMVRDMGIEHGDKVKVTDKKSGEFKNNYWFEIVEKGKGPNPERIELKYCKVEKDAGEYIVQEYENGLIRIDEIPYSFIINEQDANTFEIKNGDIIDVAYYRNNPTNTMRVLYKYELHESISQTLEQKRLSFATNKKAEDVNKVEIEKDFVINPRLFKNRKVLIVGGGSRKKDYLNAFSKFGAILEHATGDEDKTRITSMVTRADVVAISIGECSHDASQYTIRECKKFNKPFNWTDRNGIQSILMCAEEAIKRGEELVS